MTKTKGEKDKAPIYLVRFRDGLVPRSRLDAELLEDFRFGSPIRAVMTQGRNEAQHRLYWVILNLCIKSGQTGYRTAETMHWALKLKLGFIEEIRMWGGGGSLIRPKSIAFDQMDQSEFKQFFDAALQALSEEGFDTDALLAEAIRNERPNANARRAA